MNIGKSESAPKRGMVRNFMHLGLGQVVTTIVTILTNAAIARALSPADFGLMYLLMAIATFTFVIVDWGHGQYIIRETARNPERAGDLLGSALALRTGGAVVGCAVAVAITWLLGYDLRTRLLTAALILGWLPQYLGLSFGWVFRGRERMDSDAVLNVVFKVATLVGSIVCLAIGGRLLGLVVAWSIAGLLTLMLGIVMYRRLQLPTLSSTVSTMRELLRDGAPLLALALAVAIEPYINANVLYKMASPAVVGWYGAAWTIGGTLIAPVLVLGGAMYPRLSTAASDPAEFKRVFERSFRPLFLLAVLGAVGTYLFADVPVALIYSLPKFAPASDIVRAFSPVLLLLYVNLFLGTAIVALGRSGWMASAKIASVVVMTILVFILVPLCQSRYGNGGLGVMYATTIGESLMLIAAWILIREVLDARVLGDVCRCLLAGVVTLLLIRPLSGLSPFLTIPLCVLAFGIAACLVGAVRRSDADMLLGSFRKPALPR
jgi:O-antigen/teichoic acid export membrane protein